MQKSPMFDFARGWFLIGFSEEVERGQLKSMRYFDQELIMFRGQSGDVSVLNAFCPHLGAHIGVGGEVQGDAVRCPFHAWKFDGTGKCTEVPYAKKIPKKAEIRSWVVQEKSGMIFMYHDPEGKPPYFDIPEIEEYDEDGWTRWDHSLLEIKTHPREIVENVADFGHFQPVHGTVPEIFENEFKDHMAVQRNKGVAYPRGGGVDHYDLTATYHGPAYQMTRMDGVLKSRMVNAHTPIDHNTLHLRFGVFLKSVASEDKMNQFAQKYIENLRTGFLEDVAIWENKLWRDRPTLCSGDGAIGRLRKWYRQFYLPRS